MRRSVAERLHIYGGDVVTPEGVVAGGSLLVRDDVIEAVLPMAPVGIDARALDATGMVVLPGVINAHAHGCTVGPLFSSGASPLAREQVIRNLDRHLAAGVTTLVNVCGFGLPDSLVEHPVDVRLSTNHLLDAFTAADLVDAAGLTSAERNMSVERMAEHGAILIGEVGSGATLGGGVAAYRYIPAAVLAATGLHISPAVATQLIDSLVGDSRLATPRRGHLAAAMSAAGLPPTARAAVVDAILTFAVAPVRASLGSFGQAVAAAERTGLPAMFHAAGPSAQALLDLARTSDATLVAGHLNHPSLREEELAGLATALREANVVVDVSSLDMVHAQKLTTPQSADLLAEAGLVDTLSTDYAGGAWEPMLAVADRWWRRGYVDLQDIARMCSSRPAELLGLCDRGSLSAGRRADVVLTLADDLESVRTVIIGGVAHPNA